MDERIELMGLAMSFGQGGGSASSWVNSLSEHLGEAVRLWASMLRTPRFDSTQVALWRGAELERVRRGRDDPGTLAFSRFNHIMYGDHPVGWELGEADLEPEDLAPDRLRHVHGAVICPANMVLGVAGDLTWDRAEALLREVLEDWAPCSGALLDDPVPEIREEPGVFVIHKQIEQSVVVMAHSSRVRQGDTPSVFRVPSRELDPGSLRLLQPPGFRGTYTRRPGLRGIVDLDDVQQERWPGRRPHQNQP